jgi:PAS domain S-box-containing protein
MADPTQTTILYVDDNAASRYAFAGLFRGEGFDVLEAATGTEALRLAGDKPDMVILDVNLPDINGFEVCRRIKAHPATTSIPVLHLSASFVSSEDKVSGLEGGADGYLIKPVEPRELVAQVNALLRIHRAEEQLREAATQWQVTFDAISDGVCLLDRSGKVLRCNLALAGFLQKSLSEIVGCNWHMLANSSGLGEGEALFGRIGKSRHRESITLRLKNRWFQVIEDPIVDEDRVSGAVVILADITERQNLEEQLRQAQRVEAVGRLAGGIAHDFNNMLTAITSTFFILQADLPEDHPNRDLLRTAEQTAWRAVELTRQLLRFSRRGKLEMQTIFLGSSIEETVGMLRRTFDHSVAIETRVDPRLWPIQADSTQIHQVLLNLCLNARDAMPKGGRLLVEADNVSLPEDASLSNVDARPGKFVGLRVTDTGHGIPPEIKPSIFDPFFTTKEQGKGTGLGLSIVFGIVKQHRGWIDCSSEPGLGTCFTIHFPISLSHVELAD